MLGHAPGEDSPRVLLLGVHCYPPASPEALVNANLARAMLTAGWDLTIVARDSARTSVYPPDADGQWEDVRGATTLVPCLPRPQEAPGAGRVRRLVVELGRLASGVTWTVSATRTALRMARRKRPDVILARAAPVFGPLAGSLVSSVTRIPLVVNWNDPEPCAFMPPPYGGGASRPLPFVWRVVLRWVMRCAAGLSFPTERLGLYMRAYLPSAEPLPWAVIPHVLGSQCAPAIRRTRREFVLCHLGRLSAERNPATLLEAVARFRATRPDVHLKVMFVGRADGVAAQVLRTFDLSDSIEVLPPMSHEKCMRVLESVDVAVLIEAPLDEGIFLPSKLVEHVCAGKPTLALSPREGVLQDLIQRHGGGVCVDGRSVQAILCGLQRLSDSWQRGELEREFSVAELKLRFAPSTVLTELRDLLAKVVSWSGSTATPDTVRIQRASRSTCA